MILRNRYHFIDLRFYFVISLDYVIYIFKNYRIIIKIFIYIVSRNNRMDYVSRDIWNVYWEAYINLVQLIR